MANSWVSAFIMTFVPNTGLFKSCWLNYGNNNGVDPYKAHKRDKRFSTAAGNEITTNMVKPSGGFQRKSCCNNKNFSSNADNDNYSEQIGL